MSLDRFSSEPAGFDYVHGSPDAGGGTLVTALADHAEPAAALLKALSHEGRLMILCHLAGGEKSVTELEGLIGQRQAAVSQQLARLRLEGLVATRREGKAIFYSVRDARVVALLSSLPRLFHTAA
jgi:DNA-binding transcriptional ArsR family regulator